MSMDKVWVAVKNRQAKDLNRQPLYEIKQYVVDRYTKKSVCLKCGRNYPKERCFETEEECKASVEDGWKPRRFGEYV